MTFTTTSMQNADTARSQVPTVNHFHRMTMRLSEATMRKRQIESALMWRFGSDAALCPAVRLIRAGLTLLWMK